MTGQRWFASIYDDAFCNIVIKRHFALSCGTKRKLAMTDNDGLLRFMMTPFVMSLASVITLLV
jgi:hypothetical protein